MAVPTEEATMLPDQLTAPRLAELLGLGALGLAILWRPRYRCWWQRCPHHGTTVRAETRLERELHEREAGRGESER